MGIEERMIEKFSLDLRRNRTVWEIYFGYIIVIRKNIRVNRFLKIFVRK